MAAMGKQHRAIGKDLWENKTSTLLLDYLHQKELHLIGPTYGSCLLGSDGWLRLCNILIDSNHRGPLVYTSPKDSNFGGHWLPPCLYMYAQTRSNPH